MSPQVTFELITAIQQKSYLKSLEIAKAPISKELTKKIADYAATSKHLEDLDISWNALHPDSFPYFLEQIQANKKLQFLNISYNNIVETSLSSFSPISKKHVYALTDNQLEVADKLFRFLRHGKRLIHVDLTGTNLSEPMFLQMIPGIKKSGTLMSVHFSGNPGVTKHVKQEA